MHAGIKVRVYCPVGKSDNGKFALNVSVKELDIFTRCIPLSFFLLHVEILNFMLFNLVIT